MGAESVMGVGPRDGIRYNLVMLAVSMLKYC